MTDVTVPSIPRVNDYLLGGMTNFAADREFAEKIAQRVPEVRHALRADREFLRRVVRYLAGECGVRQFLALGSGLPTRDNVYEVVHGYAPQARVVCVHDDDDLTLVAHARAVSGFGDDSVAVQGDPRDPDAILAAPEVRSFLDYGEPIALLVLTTLCFVADEHWPYETVPRLTAALAPGSHLAISIPLRPQSRLFRDLDLVEPGLVPITSWRPDDPDRDPGRVRIYGGVARKP